MPDETGDALGWDSIDAAFAHVYPGIEPHHVAPDVATALGGVLDGISAFATDDHWHFVTYGLTELFEKDSQDAELSGWGYELTPITPASKRPPAWAFELLVAVARLTQEQGTWLAPGRRLETGSDVTGGKGPLDRARVLARPPRWTVIIPLRRLPVPATGGCDRIRARRDEDLRHGRCHRAAPVTRPAAPHRCRRQ